MKKLFVIISIVALLVSCVDSLDDYNVDSKRATNIPAETLFTASLKSLSDALTTPNVNLNNFRLYVQHWATTTYLDEPRYNLTARTIPQALWQSIYRDVLSDLKESKRLIEADILLSPGDKNNQIGQIEIIEVYAWSVLVNTFGNIPYTQALDIKTPLPVYDDAATVYDDLLVRLDGALAKLNLDSDGFSTGDVVYHGDIDQWIKFGNSLKLKMGMTLSDVALAKAKTIVEASAPNVFTSNADNATFQYISSPPNNNPLSANLNPLYSTRQDFVIASTIVDKMNTVNDPRRAFYFTKVGGQFVGGNYGFSNVYANFSKVNAHIISPEFEALLMDNSEVEFLLAEAAARGFSLTGDAAGTAEEHYNKAVEASILYWGGTQADADAYLSQTAVAYSTAAGNFQEKIATQKWIALFNRGFDAWMEWKRLDYPAILPPSGNGAPVGLAIPVRLIYPVNEQTLNGQNRDAAANAIGGDLATTKIFWDVN